MNKNWSLSQEAFDALLDWLDSDREQAGIKYEQIRSRLIVFFAGRGCINAEDLADETINRVTSKVNEIQKEFDGDPALYFYGVAKWVYTEYLRRKTPQSQSAPIDSARAELEFRCLERCVARLSEEDRALLLKDYGAKGQTQAERRKALADELGITLNALRIRVFRIRTGLKVCIEKCIQDSL
ncbi:MAG TPA: sigma-70 family RNA polymerase sigma factor [Pyrinomonadaceae bacterium]|jgi:DNA-directed RNA polymerase specialized sigma24 family protein|nr:sigma-70 family RNA polymerase sigma factor [Pyrinomonadaceae bacterium]